jgi:stress-induced morphogen
MIPTCMRELVNAASQHRISLTWRLTTSGRCRHHAAMRAQGGGNGESHFTVEVVSSEFEGKVSYGTSHSCCPYAYPCTTQRQMQRHRLIYSTLQAELDAGLHALVIKAKTPREAGMEDASEEAVEAPPASAGEKAAAGP